MADGGEVCEGLGHFCRRGGWVHGDEVRRLLEDFGSACWCATYVQLPRCTYDKVILYTLNMHVDARRD